MTLRDLDEAGKDVRAWCFECARGDRIDSIVWTHFAERHWPIALDAAARQFRCKECGSSQHVALFPATRPYERPMTGTDLVAAFFFGTRKAAKDRKRDSINERAAARLEEGRARRGIPKRERPPPPVLTLAWSRPDA